MQTKIHHRYSNSASIRALLVAGALASLAFTQGLSAQVILDQGHVDLDFNYSGGSWQVGVHHDSVGYLNPSDVVFHARDEAWNAGARINRPSGSQWDFIGTEAGEPIWILPQTQEPSIVWPGFASEETAPGTFAAYSSLDPRVTDTPSRWITIQLKSVEYIGEGTGNFSLWSTGALGATTVWMSTVDGITTNDSFLFLEGGHVHLNWGFTDIGLYKITLEASGYLNDGSMTPTSSGDWTYNFGVGVVPEPQTIGFLALAALAVLLLRRRND
ncbi:TIGR03769 domain-containing protein [Ruficoccus amylovorans]|uniref:TIGR03769 domain-containing protein n=1 Tax=Ruficoccus amylovorans TaxID=1804625 RepID=A0A842HBU2_9BACT|nr:choice-of-anchor M domain-containing protein [Ruficoccus amylovorans]MBC2593034.1 TIGR03769 domain-containing protein [Ruficoccus amylovorans]